MSSSQKEDDSKEVGADVKEEEEVRVSVASITKVQQMLEAPIFGLYFVFSEKNEMKTSLCKTKITDSSQIQRTSDWSAILVVLFVTLGPDEPYITKLIPPLRTR